MPGDPEWTQTNSEHLNLLKAVSAWIVKDPVINHNCFSGMGLASYDVQLMSVSVVKLRAVVRPCLACLLHTSARLSSLCRASLNLIPLNLFLVAFLPNPISKQRENVISQARMSVNSWSNLFNLNTSSKQSFLTAECPDPLYENKFKGLVLLPG